MSWKEDAQDLIDELSVKRHDIENHMFDLKHAIYNNDKSQYENVRDEIEEN